MTDPFFEDITSRIDTKCEKCGHLFNKYETFDSGIFSPCKKCGGTSFRSKSLIGNGTDLWSINPTTGKKRTVHLPYRWTDDFDE